MRWALGLFFLLASVGASVRMDAVADEPGSWVRPDLDRLAAGKRQIRPFDYEGVTLESGTLRRQFDEVRDYYLRIPSDDLLKGFRKRAGKPAPGADLGGWYTPDVFNIFGQILSGLARMYAATGDSACREKLDMLVAEWGKTVAPDGFFFYSDKPNAPHYGYDKLAAGLLDAYVYGRNRSALGYLSRITDWAIKTLDQKRPYAINSPRGDTEWYTLSENLYRAYLVTGDRKYRDYGSVWEYTRYWELFASRSDIFAPFSHTPFQAYHAYSHVNTLSSAAAAYWVTGQPHYLDTLKNAHDFLVNNEIFATGGFGPRERLLPVGSNIETLVRLGFHFETQCGSWAVFKLGKYLTSFTGDARYGDWIELVLINGIGASIPMATDGTVFYFSDYNIDGAAKSQININAWSCCAGTRPIAAADFHDLIYFHDDANVYVNLFTPSSLDWTRNGARVRLTQRTRFPEEERTEFHFVLDRPSSFGLKLRIPGWLTGPMQVTVNGRPVQARADLKNWAVIARTWQNGDRVAVTLPAKFWLSRLPGSAAAPVAVMRGPVTMAFRSPSGNPSPKFNFDDVSANFEEQPAQRLHYHLRSDAEILARPFYEFKEGERYFMYLHPDIEQWARPIRITAKPSISAMPWFSFTTSVDSTIEYPFTGSSVRWTGFRFEDGGKAEVRIDGAVVGVVDQYGPARRPMNPPVGAAIPFEWKHSGLAPGNHTLTIRTLPEKNSASTGNRITVARIEAAP